MFIFHFVFNREFLASSGFLDCLIIFITLSIFSTLTDNPIKIWTRSSAFFRSYLVFFITTSLLLISKFPSYSFKKIVIQRKATIFLLFGIVLFFGLLLIYPFNVISISAIIYLGMLPISFFHYQKLKKQNEDQNYKDEDDDLEDIL